MVSSLTLTVDFLVLAGSLAAFLAICDYQRRGGLPYPPGPRPLPIIGNLFNIPKEFSWLNYTQFSKKHGEIVSFHVFGKVIVILNSVKATKELFERRGEIYSDRPVIPIHEMYVLSRMKCDWVVAFEGFTELWRRSRKFLDSSLRKGGITAYHPAQQAKARTLLIKLLANPDELEAHLESLTGSLILEMAYGYQVQGPNDRNVLNSRLIAQLASETLHPGALLVNDLPFLRHIPEWLSWLSYKPLARYGYELGQEVLHRPMEFVKESILNGTAQPSLALNGLQETEKLSGAEREKEEEAMAGSLATMFGAGTDTTVSLVMSLLVAILLHPETQATAQQELDAVTGRKRLPTFEDRQMLPFVDAVCKEAMRWRPVTPLAIPHATTRDDVYEGFFIPKGALIIGNAWAILHDPVMYPDPDDFKPERFVNPDGSLRNDPVLATGFGFGRRICPGRHFVDATVFILVASLLSVFNFEKQKGTDGGADTFPYTGSGTSRPLPFRCSITPRDKWAEELIVADSEPVLH